MTRIAALGGATRTEDALILPDRLLLDQLRDLCGDPRGKHFQGWRF